MGVERNWRNIHGLIVFVGAMDMGILGFVIVLKKIKIIIIINKYKLVFDQFSGFKFVITNIWVMLMRFLCIKVMYIGRMCDGHEPIIRICELNGVEAWLCGCNDI